MDLFLQQVFNGLTLGSVYTLVAIGLTLVFGILHIPNFAHGALYLIGGYVTLMVMTATGVHYFIAIIASIVVVAVLAVLMERLVFHPLRNSPPIHDKIAAIGLVLFFEALVQLVWGTEYLRMLTPFDNNISVAGVSMTSQRLLVIAVTFAVVVLLTLFLKKTMMGASILAMAQNREGAFLVGINANKVAMMTFAISGALAAIAASLASPINLVFPAMGHLVILKAFVVVIIGGMGSIPGAIIAGLILGLTESMGATYISNDYKDMIAFLLLIVIMTVRPKGLFAKGVY
ncbi:branched-chain amino acid ABC transporter permease [Microbacterium sp. APC 3898]|uniref:Branched-chain amino acid ABC transporter permease n=1 Tax=Planococcus notacanthi TaxID=3035188 RepID=A0ABT7ZLK8_9BACL|nr:MULTISPECIES: branched-chain amino acid ABC transporter permease [Terrabacteria group]MDN3428035.1 branched-chain amino acid ABC transporter permease [Planococcus sp. APC 4016]MDN3498430.1 branched-chain amino acid ABC transporter permease [Microbacterium sp. APC 3898]